MLEIETVKRLTDGPLGMLNQGLARSNREGWSNMIDRSKDRKFSGWIDG
jgi:hypothetical protein